MKDYKYKVATQCMTYNQKPYIEDALKGFVIQQTSFPVVYIIVDDASTDGETELLRNWARTNLDFEDEKNVYKKDMHYGELIFGKHKNNPNAVFAMLLLSENHYQTGRDSLKQKYIEEWTLQSEYHAICEGDDYWTCPQKLQKQVEYMENNPQCVITHTSFKYSSDDNNSLQEESERARFNISVLDKQRDIRSYILDSNRYLIQTMTVLMRTDAYLKALKEIKKYEGQFLMGDTLLWIALLDMGNIYFFNEVTSVYRIHDNSATHQKSLVNRLRFQLSCSEMRITLAEKCDLSHSYKDKFYNQYNKRLTKYLWFVPDYVPFISARYKSIWESFYFNLLRSKWIGAVAKRLYLLNKKEKA